MRHPIRKSGTLITLIVVAVAVVLIGIAVFLRAEAPPEAARLLPESDAILYLQLKTLRSATHFDQTPVARSASLEQFTAATGIVPERDLDSVALAVHRMDDPRGPNGSVAYSEVFTGHFDAVRLAAYLHSIASGEESYLNHTVYSIPSEGRTLRVTQIGYDTIAASNMPTTEQIHSMLQRSQASALSTPGSSLLAARFHEVPLLAQAWGIGRVGLPLSRNGQISVLGMQLPLAADTDFVASLRYTGDLHLRVEEFTPDEREAQTTVDAMNAILAILRGLIPVGPGDGTGANAIRAVLDSAKIARQSDRVILTAQATTAQVKSIADAQRAAATTP